MNSFISYNGFSLEYEEFGTGNYLLIAFHGFDRHSSDFRVFETSLGKKYKIISFNLPYHGNTALPVTGHPAYFTRNDLKGIINKLLEEKNRNEFSLLAYSLGGKIALACIEVFPDKIKDVYLFAPDGIKIEWWYRFVSKTKLGQEVFKTIINHPAFFLKTVYGLQKAGIINVNFFKFVAYHLENKERRQKVFDSWLIFREIIPDIKKIQEAINKNNINIHLFFGKYDVIIPKKLGEYFVKGLRNKNALHLLEMGHNLINEKTNLILSPYIQ